MRFTIYDYDLIADSGTCSECGREVVFENYCEQCGNVEVFVSYSVNNVFKGDTVEAETIEEAEKLFTLDLNLVEEDNNAFNDNVIYYRFKDNHKKAGSPACEIRITKNET